MIDDYIQSTLRRPLLASDDGKGYVYIYRDPTQPGFVKIGMTTKTPTERRRGIERTCKRQLDVVYLDDKDSEEQRPFDNYRRVENLVHDELNHRLRLFKCPNCGAEHKEWFEVDEEVAKLTVRRWIRFMRMRPYDEQGALGMMWKDRLDTMARPKSGERLEDYEIREKRWDSVVSADRVDFFCHFLKKELFEKRVRRDESLAYRLVRLRWQLLCLMLNVFMFGSELFSYWWTCTFLFFVGCVVYHLLTD